MNDNRSTNQNEEHDGSVSDNDLRGCDHYGDYDDAIEENMETPTTTITTTQTEPMTNNDHDDASASSSSGFNDDDPRLQTLFAQEPYEIPSTSISKISDDGAAETFLISENVIMDCFQWSVEHHNLPSVGFWISPNEEDAEEDDDDHKGNKFAFEDWKPASLPLPSWAIP